MHVDRLSYEHHSLGRASCPRLPPGHLTSGAGGGRRRARAGRRIRAGKSAGPDGNTGQPGRGPGRRQALRGACELRRVGQHHHLQRAGRRRHHGQPAGSAQPPQLRLPHDGRRQPPGAEPGTVHRRPGGGPEGDQHRRRLQAAGDVRLGCPHLSNARRAGPTDPRPQPDRDHRGERVRPVPGPVRERARREGRHLPHAARVRNDRPEAEHVLLPFLHLQLRPAIQAHRGPGDRARLGPTGPVSRHRQRQRHLRRLRQRATTTIDRAASPALASTSMAATSRYWR